MRNARLTIMLPVVGRARGATGLPAHLSGTLVARWGSPTPFRIPPWAHCSDRRMERRIATFVASTLLTRAAAGIVRHVRVAE